jgi:hypothetical protein
VVSNASFVGPLQEHEDRRGLRCFRCGAAQPKPRPFRMDPKAAQVLAMCGVLAGSYPAMPRVQ